MDEKGVLSVNSSQSNSNNLCFYLSHPRGEGKRAANAQNPFQRSGELFVKYSEPHTPPKEGKEKYNQIGEDSFLKQNSHQEGYSYLEEKRH